MSDCNSTAQLRRDRLYYLTDFSGFSTAHPLQLCIVPAGSGYRLGARGQVNEDTIEPFFDKVILLEILQVERPAPTLETV